MMLDQDLVLARERALDGHQEQDVVKCLPVQRGLLTHQPERRAAWLRCPGDANVELANLERVHAHLRRHDLIVS